MIPTQSPVRDKPGGRGGCDFSSLDRQGSSRLCLGSELLLSLLVGHLLQEWNVGSEWVKSGQSVQDAAQHPLILSTTPREGSHFLSVE